MTKEEVLDELIKKFDEFRASVNAEIIPHADALVAFEVSVGATPTWVSPEAAARVKKVINERRQRLGKPRLPGPQVEIWQRRGEA